MFAENIQRSIWGNGVGMKLTAISKVLLGAGFAAFLLAVCFGAAGFHRLPARGAWSQANPVTCVRNLKQVGLGFIKFTIDHEGRFPFNYSTNEGGTLEFCDQDSDGFDRNAVTHLAAISSELTVPGILVCPQDTSRKSASGFEKLRPENMTYRLRTGSNVVESNRQEPLLLCPIHKNVLHVDGTVSGPQANEKPPALSLRQMLPYSPEAQRRFRIAGWSALAGVVLILFGEILRARKKS